MERVQQKIKEVFKFLGFTDLKIDIKKDNSLKDKELLRVNIKMSPEDAKPFLEEGAIGLSSLQHLLRVLCFKRGLSQGLLILDINNHRKKREEDLTKLALDAAEKVKKTKKAVILEPMSAYERRFIHMKLAEEPDIVTESTGQEPERKVVVRLYP